MKEMGSKALLPVEEKNPIEYLTKSLQKMPLPAYYPQW
jgi:hypothetical protein